MQMINIKHFEFESITKFGLSLIFKRDVSLMSANLVAVFNKILLMFYSSKLMITFLKE